MRWIRDWQHHRLGDTVMAAITNAAIFGVFIGLTGGVTRGVLGAILCGSIAGIIRFGLWSSAGSVAKNPLVIVILLSLPFIAVLVVSIWL
jgi:hypothetical protein